MFFPVAPLTMIRADQSSFTPAFTPANQPPISPRRAVDYFIGDCDAAAGRSHWQQRGLLDHSRNFYAPNGFDDPKRRHLLWGWINGFQNGHGWNGCLTLPRVISVQGGELWQEP